MLKSELMGITSVGASMLVVTSIRATSIQSMPLEANDSGILTIIFPVTHYSTEAPDI